MKEYGGEKDVLADSVDSGVTRKLDVNICY